MQIFIIIIISVEVWKFLSYRILLFYDKQRFILKLL